MKKLPAPNTYILMIVLVLMGSSVACRIFEIVRLVGEVAEQSCSPISRAEYEYYAERLGETPKTPKYPESAGYEVCEIKNIHDEWEVVSVRMSEGYRDEDENSEPAKSERVEDNEEYGEEDEKGEPNIAGTYIGVFPPPRYEDWYRAEEEYIINIAEDGTVSGSVIVVTKSDVVTGNCTTHSEYNSRSTISGHISGTSGVVTVTTFEFNYTDTTNCVAGSFISTTKDVVCDASKITISGNQLTVFAESSDPSITCGNVFVATKE